MKNIEKYYSEFMNKSHINPNCYWFKVIRGNKYCDCISCEQCGEKFLEWLNEEYKEPIEITKVQYEILKCLAQCSKIAIKNNKINIRKDNLEYFLSKIGVQIIELDCDDKQIKIKDILEKCEVEE